MYGVGFNAATNDTTRFISPVTLSSEWPTLGRLLFMVVCSCTGTTMNGFFVASFFVEPSLKRAGNVFLAYIGLSDLLITTTVMPTSAVVILSAGEWDVLCVCRLMQLLIGISTYCYSIFYSFLSTEAYYRICGTPQQYKRFMKMKLVPVSLAVLGLAIFLTVIGVSWQLDYDYCERKHFGNMYFRVSMTIVFHVIPGIISLTFMILCSVRVRQRAREHMYYKRSQQFERDYSISSLNLTAYILYVLFWLPYLYMAVQAPDAPDQRFYHTIWFAIIRSVFSSFLYSSMNSSFRRAFAHLFYYCCCKSTLSGSFNNRHRRALEHKSATCDVRVHIMHQAVNAGSSQRGASTSRETQEL